jgi:CRISPR type I-E-associated protein CasB/Cse2
MTDTAKQEPKPFDTVVGKLLSEIERAFNNKSAVINRGDISAFRRMNPSLPTPGFWKLMAAVHVEGAPGTDERWAVVVKAMALMTPNLQSSMSPGAALARAGFSATSDLRINRLLKAEGAAFDDYMLSAIRYLANKAVGVNWWRFADFLHWPTDKRKLQLAKDFYLSKKD